MPGSDRQDLADFLRSGSPEAFERLAARYAPMVYSVCLRGVTRPEDAQDAAQATFLVLARRAGSVRPESLASWLQGVAIRCARTAVRAAAARSRHEEEAARMRHAADPVANSAAADWESVRPHLDAEVERLPGKLREAVIRHFLAGRSHAELAEELGVPRATAASRVQLGLERLRAGLTRRGVMLGAAALGTALLANAQASAPAALLASLPQLATGAAAIGASAGAGVNASALAEGVMKMMFWAKVKLAAAVVAAVMVVGAGSGAVMAQLAAGEPAKPEVAAPAPSPAPAEKIERKGPLAELPSKPGPHIEKIKALGDNEWLNLGKPTPDPKWGEANGRSWCSNLAYVPEYQGAFLSGAGVHGYVKPNGHFQGDDLWFYDRNAHRWICIYPGVEVKTLAQRIRSKEVTVDEKTGLLTGPDGQPLPPYATHAWALMGYDSDRKEFVNLCSQQVGDYFTVSKGNLMSEAWELFQDQRKGKTFPALSPMFYQAATDKWSCVATNEDPKAGFYNNLLYIKPMKKFFFGGPPGVWFYDRAQNKWNQVKTQGEKLPDGYDNVACYDSKRNCVYYGMNKGDRLYIYNLAAAKWSKAMPKGDGPHAYMSCNNSFYYDSVNDVVVSFSYGKRHLGNPEAWKEGVFVYDPATNTWSGPQSFPAGLDTGKTFSTFFDPDVNAAFLFCAPDSGDGGQMWVYRHKKAAK